ncbi:hypothetical protein CN151_15730 [Sinorhizobium meliloti]|uniref:hypothetical protein n=1 Tax=Rhizobium meliloti TaxID=382 RepID=UPI0002A5AC53|nr:hypothetical protein [Sinorhizobium meliloti]AGA07733.1 hypothetical protein C770_GR4Chr2825 [Sinorhizobium meliloti GR4]RVL03179.1 hypothetical protein CN151_15730 [Sinorhizobium meliloti]RVM94484.1 hypothetical protein CN119_11680 [Sinorhizobium meliloti]RVN11305.1 hypothetical protein CN112_10450 [Sinorhizobium meliloti]
MIPIKLHWRRYADGFERDAEKPNILRARSERMDPVTYDLADLENPVVLHLMNCRTDEDCIAFMNRFGPLANLKSQQDLWFISRQPEVFRLNAMFTVDKRLFRSDRAHFVNTVMGAISLRPSYVYSDSSGRGRLVLEAATLHDFMMMEFAAIHEAGAVATSCEHCGRIFLTGPLTGRRSHAKYCSDRCRVAAMRARNAAKEED